MKPNINSINVHSKLNYNVHPMDGALAMLVHCCKMGILLVPGFCTFHKINKFFNFLKRLTFYLVNLKICFVLNFKLESYHMIIDCCGN
jgi:hypothetical protein